MSRHRGYCFTYNNYDDEGIARIQALQAKYLVFGKEVAESGTPHLQGLIVFSNGKTHSAARKLLVGCHVEAAKDAVQAAAYCKKGTQAHSEWKELGVDGPDYGKDSDIYERGEAPRSKAAVGEAEKERWKRALELAKSGKLDEIDPDIYMRYYSTCKRIKQDHQVVPESIEKLDFYWYVGPSGTGKSKTAREKFPGAYIKNSNKWWDGYANHDAVIIEEWDPSLACMASFMKKWADHYAFNAETKGGTMMARPKTIVVTSNYTIRECFPNEADHLPLERRFTVREFSPSNDTIFSNAECTFGAEGDTQF